jgi:hypothetical protein
VQIADLTEASRFESHAVWPTLQLRAANGGMDATSFVEQNPIYMNLRNSRGFPEGKTEILAAITSFFIGNYVKLQNIHAVPV